MIFNMTGGAGGAGGYTELLTVTLTGDPISSIPIIATMVDGDTVTGSTDTDGHAVLELPTGVEWMVRPQTASTVVPVDAKNVTMIYGTAQSMSFVMTKYSYATVSVVAQEGDTVIGTVITATPTTGDAVTATIDSGTSATLTLIPGEYTISAQTVDGRKTNTSTITAVAGQSYNITLNVVYNLVYGYQITEAEPNPVTRVTIPATVFDQSNAAASVEKATAVGSPGGWASVPLISEMNFNESFNGDAMVYVPTWYKRKETVNGVTTVAYSQEKLSDEWLDLAGSVGDERIGHFRVGKYLTSTGHVSEVNTTPLVNTSISTFISSAQNRTYNSNKYDIMTWYQWDYLTDLLPMIYGTTNLQTIMRGYADGHLGVTKSVPLTEDAIGMAGSSADGRIAVFGIHDLWGNALQFVGGARTDGSCNLWCRKGLSATTNPTTANGWFKARDGASVDGYLSKVAGTTLAGNFPSTTGGSATTYFADRGGVNSSCFPRVGGAYDDGDRAGPFDAYFNYSAADANTYVGSRLSYRY